MTAPAPRDGGDLLLYLRPFSQESARLRFRLDGMTAVGEDGAATPLVLRFEEVRGDGMTRERYLAAGRLPAGRYAGLSIGIASASLRGEEGIADLKVPPEPETMTVPFTIARGQGVVLSLEFDYRASVEGGFRFTPVFTAAPPPRPATGLIALASSRGDDRVMLFDKASGRVVGAVPTGRRPSGLAFDEERRRAYVAVAGDDTVEIIDVLEYRRLGRVELRSGDEPIAVALTPDGRTLLTANVGSSSVTFVDTLSMVESLRLPLQDLSSPMALGERGAAGEQPSEILVDREGRRAYVFNISSGNITVIDITARRVVQEIPTELGPFRGDFNRLEDELFAIHRSSPYLSIIDPLALGVRSRIYVGPGMTAVKVNRETDQVYLANASIDSLEIYDPIALLPIDSIPIGGRVSYLVIDGQRNNLYAVMPGIGEVRILRIVGRKTIARVEVGDEPYDVVLSGER